MNGTISEILIIIACGLIIIGLLVGLAVGFVDMCGVKPLEEVEIPCVITHMDIDNGDNLISVVAVDGSFSGTIQVPSEVYAKYDIGDACTVVQGGYDYPISRDQFKYKIVA